MTVKGREKPRLQTPDPVGRWTEKNTLGFKCIRFAEDFLGLTLMPWQKYALLRILATHPDGSFRYRTVLLLVGRQSGKTTLLQVLVLFLMYVGRRAGGDYAPARLVLGAAQSVNIANETWQTVIDRAEGDADLAAQIKTVRRANGSQEFRLTNGSRYMVTATTRSAGRGLSVDVLLMDELREHRDWNAWNALTSTTIAQSDALIMATSNAGDDESVVLNNLREAALLGTDPGLCLLEWSAPDGADIDDPEMWAFGCPALGYRISVNTLRTERATKTPNGFRTENMCQRVIERDAIITPEAWAACSDRGLSSFEAQRGRVMLTIDVAPSLDHVTLCSAAKSVGDGYRGAVVAAWGSTDEARLALPDLIEAIKPHSVGWYPGGPAAAIGADLAKLRGTKIVELKGVDVAAACQGLVELVQSRRMVHAEEPLLTAHVTGASKTSAGDGYRFTRKGGPCDAAYALAGALHMARTTKVVGKPRIVVAA